MTDFLETVRQRCQFPAWFLGHYHTNLIIDGRYILQWEQISKVNENRALSWLEGARSHK